MELYRVGWSILREIDPSWFEEVEFVVSILTGGAFPGIYIANSLEVPCYFVRAKGYLGREYQENLRFANFDVLEKSVKNKKGLIVDDIYDTGRTLRFTKKWLTRMSGVEPQGFVLVTKVKDCGVRYLRLVSRNTWVIFPWEVKG